MATATSKKKQEAHQLLGQAKRRGTKIRPTPSKLSFSVVFYNLDKWQPEVADDVIWQSIWSAWMPM